MKPLMRWALRTAALWAITEVLKLASEKVRNGRRGPTLGPRAALPKFAPPRAADSSTAR